MKQPCGKHGCGDFLNNTYGGTFPRLRQSAWTKDELDAELGYGEHGEPCTLEPNRVNRKNEANSADG